MTASGDRKRGLHRKYMFGAGGTSGHINPALAIADHVRLKEPDADILFCGIINGLEHEMTGRSGYEMKGIRALGVPEQTRRGIGSFLTENTAGVLESRRLIKHFKPDVVISTGGYVGGPLVTAALWSRVPVLLHEQNAYPGRANRLLAPYTHSVCISFPESGKYFSKRTHLVLSGNPVRPVFFEAERALSRKKLGIADDVFQILLLGGSLGASSLSKAVIGLQDVPLWHTLRTDHNVRLTMSTGKEQAADFLAQANGVDGVHAVAYLHDVPDWMAASDLFIGRAGAMTCSELAAVGLPSILVPYPFAANDHQTFNALTMMNAGASDTIDDARLTSAWMTNAIMELINNPEKRNDMSLAARRLAIHDALDIIYAELRRIRKHGNSA